MRYSWTYGSNREQEYYETKVGKDYLCVFRNKFDRDHVIWMGHIEEHGKSFGSHVLYDKKRNDEWRKAEGLPKGADLTKLRRVSILCSDDPNIMMEKVEEAYTKGVREL